MELLKYIYVIFFVKLVICQRLKNLNEPSIKKFICSLQFENVHECYCAIIDETTVITAAQCFYEKYNEIYYTVATGADFSVQHKVKSLNSGHFVYQDPYFDDIVEVHLSEPIKFIHGETEAVAKPTQEECETNFPYGREALIWGPSKQNSNSDMIKVKFLENTDYGCEAYMKDVKLTETMFCVGWGNGKIDSCKGEVGSPAIHNNKLYGIASWGQGCKRPTRGHVYANYCKFIYKYFDDEDRNFQEYSDHYDAIDE